MNLGAFLHGESKIQAISHWPSFQINELTKHWYFYSIKQITLRKKVENTSVVSFLQSHLKATAKQGQNQDDQSDNFVILQVREIDRRQPKDAELNCIKTKKINLSQILDRPKLSDQQLIKNNQWKPFINQQITLYKIANPQLNKIYNLYWSDNIITCKAPISTYMRNRLTEYATNVAKLVQSKILKQLSKIKAFQLVFTFDSKNGKIKMLFAQNFLLSTTSFHQVLALTDEHALIQKQGFSERLKNKNAKITNAKQMYWTDLKIGQDDYQQIQLLIQSQDQKLDNNLYKGKQTLVENEQSQQQTLAKLLKPSFERLDQPDNQYSRVQQKRLKYIKTLQKLTNQQNQFSKKLNIALKKQQKKAESKQFQCEACHSYVILNQFQSQKMVSNNRIPQIQLLRQVKMKMKSCSLFDYELVPVCELCYQKFVEIVQERQTQIKKVQNSNNKKVGGNLENKTQIINKCQNQLKKDDKTRQKRIIPISIQNFARQKSYTTYQNTGKYSISNKNKKQRIAKLIGKREQNCKSNTHETTVPQSIKSIGHNDEQKQKQQKQQQQDRQIKVDRKYLIPMQFSKTRSSKNNRHQSALAKQVSFDRTSKNSEKNRQNQKQRNWSKYQSPSIQVMQQIRPKQANERKNKKQESICDHETDDDLADALFQYQFGSKTKQNMNSVRNSQHRNRGFNKYRIGNF